MTSVPVRRPLRRLPLALVVAAFGAALVVVPGGPAVAQAKRSVQIDGTAANQWVPANVAIKPGGTVTFRVADGQTHPVGSGATPPARDKRFDDSNCQPPQHMAKVGASCTVTFPKAGTYPFFCEVHYSLGMRGVVTAGSGGPTASTTATTAGGAPVVTAPSAPPAVARASGDLLSRVGPVRPWRPAGAGTDRPLRALHPRFNRQKR
jgi:plastocyanin